jgi:ribosome-associated toxin RatA of RatAB toxin-antitoxin module
LTTAAAPGSALPPMPAFDRVLFAKMYAGVISSEASDNEGHGGKVHAFEICKCDIESLWAVLTNHGPFAEFVPRVTSMVISRRTDRSERARQTVDATVATVVYSLDYAWDPATRRIEFHLVEDEPHDLKAVQGSWQLWPIEHGKATLLEYTSAVDTGKQIPGFIRDYLADRGVKDTLGAVRTRAETHPIESKP